MTDHDICRLDLRSAVEDTHSTAEVTGDCKIANSHHYWVKVGNEEYEVEACCRWAARTKALDRHARTAPRAGRED